MKKRLSLVLGSLALVMMMALFGPVVSAAEPSSIQIVPPSSTATAADARIAGNYLEVRSCDVFTGPCFANAEMGQDGREAMLVWNIQHGSWKQTDLAGLSVIAVVRTKSTLGDIKYEEPKGDTVLIVDDRATKTQRQAFVGFARANASKLIGKVLKTHALPIETNIGNCLKNGTCAKVKAGKLVHIVTRCLCDDDHVCGNEYLYYPPLTKINRPIAAFTEAFSYQGHELNLRWATTGSRSAYVGTFAL